MTQAAAPVITPPGGSYGAPPQITLTAGNPGAVIRYTLDGSTPSAGSGTVYAGPFPLNSSATVNAICTVAGLTPSSVVSASFTVAGWQGWLGANGLPLDTVATDDEDGDGVSNLQEYALGGLPSDATSAPRPVMDLNPAGDRLRLAFTRQARGDLRYIVQASNDLGDWSTVIFTSEGAANTETTIVVEDTVTIASQSQRFLRLKLEIVP
jgi:hypothetical protein